MPVSFDRRSKVLLALVVSMTLGAGLLMLLAPEPGAVPATGYPMFGPINQSPPAEPAYLRFEGEVAGWQRIVIHGLNDARRGDYHFVIDSAGTAEATDRWRRQLPAGDQRPGDPLTVAVAVAGQLDGEPPSAAQLQTVRQLVVRLEGRLKLATSRVYLHSQLESVPCPGSAFERAWQDSATF